MNDNRPLSLTPNIPAASTLRTLSSAGRWGDNTVAHVQTGEMMLPPELLEANPELKAAIHQAFVRVGANPTDFVAGSEGMSINPETGLPEFGLFSSIGKVLKKIAKSPIGKIAIPLAVSFIPGAGPLAVAAASAATTKIGGGSWGEALGAGAGSYLGSSLGSSLFGQGVVPTAAGQMGPLQATSGLLGNGGKVFGASTFGDIIGNSLGSKIATTSLASAIGTFAGTSIGESLGGQLLGSSIKTPDAEADWGGTIGQMSTPNTSPVLALPGDVNSTVTTPTAANQGSGVDVSGVGYLQSIKDRNTGKSSYQPTNSVFGSNYGSRSGGWGSGVVFA